MQPTNGLIHISDSKQEIFRKTKQNTSIQLLYFFSLFDLFYILILIFEIQKEGGSKLQQKTSQDVALTLEDIEYISQANISNKATFSTQQKGANFSYTLRPYGHKAVKVL